MQVTRFNLSNHPFILTGFRDFQRRNFRSIHRTARLFPLNRCDCRQALVSKISKRGLSLQRSVIHRLKCIDDGSLGVSSWDDWGSTVGTSDYMIFSSDGEDSDEEILVTPINDVDMPTFKKQFVTAEDALTATAHRLAMLGRLHKRHRIAHGFVTNLGLITFLTLFLAFVDWWAWRVVRQPLQSFYFLSPFIASAFLVACAGYLFVPILKRLNIRQRYKRKWSPRHFTKKGTPTVGGLFFVPIGVAVAKIMSGSSTEVCGVLAVTLAFAAVGLLDDIIGLIKYQTVGLSGGTRIILKAAAAALFSLWLYTKNISSPYGMRMVVPLPQPIGLVNLSNYYLLLTLLTFILMANGQYFVDELDGLAGGISALSFVSMSVAVLPICSDLSIFGASMAGACVGFLLHNRYKASVTMGNTGCFAIGGALAAMASSSGMFFPLFIASGLLVLEIAAVTMQILYFKVTERVCGKGHRLFQIAPLQHHLEMCGFREPFIVAGAYSMSSLLAVVASYVGLISA